MLRGYQAIIEAVERHASEGSAHRPAVLHALGGARSATLTYGELVAGARHVSETLRSGGIGPGALVGIYMERSSAMVVSLWGALRRGVDFFTITPKLKAYHFDKLQAVRESTALIVDSAALVKLGRAGVLALADKVLYLVDDGSSLLRHAATLASSHPAIHLLSLEQARAASPAVSPREPVQPLEPRMLLLTSGSTGAIKGVQVSCEELHGRALTEAGAYQLTRDDRVLNLLPFSFDVGCNQLFSTLLTGATLVISHSWQARDLCEVLERFDITGVSAVPTIWSALLAHEPRQTRSALGRLRYLAVSGGPMPAAQVLRLQALAPAVALYKTYGQTETFRSTMLLPHEVPLKPGSVGRPVPGVSLYIQREDGALAAPGERGEILHAGAGAMQGYAGDSELTRTKCVQNPFGQGTVIRTGDYGFLDSEGFLHVQGRQDRMIKTRGSRVYPQEVEEVALQHPRVEQAVAFPLTLDDSETYIGLAVQSHPLTDSEELTRFLRERLATFMQPQRLWLFQELPRTLSGKPDLRAVEELCKTEQTATVASQPSVGHC